MFELIAIFRMKKTNLFPRQAIAKILFLNSKYTWERAPHGARSPQLKILEHNNNNNNYFRKKNFRTKMHRETPMSSLV